MTRPALRKKPVGFGATIIWILLNAALVPSTGGSEENEAAAMGSTSGTRPEVRAAIKRAALEQKRVFVVVGGDWCSRCLALDKLLRSDDQIALLIGKSFIVINVNYSLKEKQQMAISVRPDKFADPRIVILGSDGTRLLIQNAADWAVKGSYDRDRILAFIRQWSAKP